MAQAERRPYDTVLPKSLHLVRVHKHLSRAAQPKYLISVF